MDRRDINSILEEAPELSDKLYCRGFLLTDADGCEDRVPVLKDWKHQRFGMTHLFVHPKLPFHIVDDCCLIGHAYDPISMMADERDILAKLQKADDFYPLFHQLTGVFTLVRIVENGLLVLGDPTGMQTVFYGVINGNSYVSSHTMLFESILDLNWDSYVRRLAAYRFFPLLGNSLPGDLTQFPEIKRLVPNHSVLLNPSGATVSRFFTPKKRMLSRKEIVDQVSELLHRNLELIAEKWQKPAISMTGGCDSKTTLACANGLYNRFSYFSYVSSDSERVDADAAAKICAALELPHTIFEIPRNDELVPGAAEAAKLLRWNTGDLCDCNANDVRKRIVFADTQEFDVEVKSWASEVGRAYYSKRFNGRTDFGAAPTPRACTSLYKFFLHNRRLVRDTDRVFERYLATFFRQDEESPIPWQEQFFWEFRMPSWNGLVITGEHRYSFDITIPYNNRILLELLLSASTEECLHDEIHSAIRERMNPKIDQTGIAVQNVKHTRRRAKLENLYYFANNLVK